MPVIEASADTLIEPNHIYVPPPHSIVTIVGNHLAIEMPPDNERIHQPIDAFFDSLGTALGEKAIGIVLSGTGSDGALGLKAIKERGGFTLAQGKDGSSPQYEEMPAGAIAIGAVDSIIPVEEIPARLLRLKDDFAQRRTNIDVAEDTNTARLTICSLLRAHLGHDFSDYRSQTFLRRVDRRMAAVNAGNLQDYIAKLKADPGEITLLFRDLLIRVTSFFRDEETFTVLADKVIPSLFEGKMADGTVRVWVPGCATGEEAYSLAILLREFMETLQASPKVQIFATDIDDSAITTARLGRYPQTLLEGLSEERRNRFFTFSHGIYCVKKEIRDLCTFSIHSLVRDPPFSMMNLVSCRNLLIYMNPSLQARIIPIFHYSLASKGILLLGNSESVAQHADLFEPVDKAARIFRRLEGGVSRISLNWQHPQIVSGSRLLESDNTLRKNHGPEALAIDALTKSMHPKAGVENLIYPNFKHLLAPVADAPEIVSQLQSALVNTQENLQSLAEEYQTAVEELRSANEELHSVNEEMQSTNEELETSKEELQSLNEELHTVNMRLNEKNDELARTNSDLKNLFESTEIATVFLDRYLIIRSFTQAIGTIFNLIPSDQGRPLTDIASQLKYKGLREDVDFVLSSLRPLERRVERVDQPVHYIMRILPYREPDSSVTGVLVTFVDVTNIVQAEAALLAADVRKDVFLATLSHELRNPLAPIRTATELLKAPSLTPEQLKEIQTIIVRQVTHLGALLDDLLDVSRITRGSFLLKKQFVDLETLIADAVVAARSGVDVKHHTLRVERLSAAITLEVDPVRITQVITNLLTNATKYTPDGGLISIGTRLESKYLIIYVRDNGVGLVEATRTTIFDMFTRVDSDAGRREGGLGVGLALAKGLIELHGGRIEVQSEGLGKGSEFTVSLPKSLIVEGPMPVPIVHRNEDSGKVSRRILLADDNRDSAQTMKMLLELQGHEIHLANSGIEALALAKRVRPDIAILDIGMPDLSGHEVAERIRHEAWGSEVTLIAVTGWGQDTDRRRSLAAGFDHHLTKPVEFEVLQQLIDRTHKKPQ